MDTALAFNSLPLHPAFLSNPPGTFFFITRRISLPLRALWDSLVPHDDRKDFPKFSQQHWRDLSHHSALPPSMPWRCTPPLPLFGFRYFFFFFFSPQRFFFTVTPSFAITHDCGDPPDLARPRSRGPLASLSHRPNATIFCVFSQQVYLGARFPGVSWSSSLHLLLLLEF